MKGEPRFILQSELSQYPKSAERVFNYFVDRYKGITPNDFDNVHFRDLYDFFDSENMLLFIEPFWKNKQAYFYHNFEIDGELWSLRAADPSVSKSCFKTRRETEMAMFKLAFKCLEEAINPTPKEKPLDTTPTLWP